ncbi:hypothetical protein [Inquilinus limosus]|uniref:Uncharacterized protein n=1 Tax=Inquilinus limosus MP06 TaxID=1398085 RepID=A0A0A0DDQ4_9PROT|nr:hypothetical protein [Inquilinus limosus]KGM36175.1 hypothetical protein P409_00575 [Inquilinus limosus MP06]
MKRKHLTDAEQSTLTNALQVAAERFDEHVKLFTELAEGGGNDFIRPRAAVSMAQQFERQAADTRSLLSVINGAESVKVEYEPDDE